MPNDETERSSSAELMDVMNIEDDADERSQASGDATGKLEAELESAGGMVMGIEKKKHGRRIFEFDAVRWERSCEREQPCGL
jgi:hypothetical protein